jgi:hypothetical protein
VHTKKYCFLLQLSQHRLTDTDQILQNVSVGTVDMLQSSPAGRMWAKSGLCEKKFGCRLKSSHYCLTDRSQKCELVSVRCGNVLIEAFGYIRSKRCSWVGGKCAAGGCYSWFWLEWIKSKRFHVWYDFKELREMFSRDENVLWLKTFQGWKHFEVENVSRLKLFRTWIYFELKCFQILKTFQIWIIFKWIARFFIIRQVRQHPVTHGFCGHSCLT